MEVPGVSSGVSDGEGPDERPDRLVRPYVGSGGPVSSAHVDNSGVSEWFPASPFKQDSAPFAPAMAAEPRRSGAAGRHRPLSVGPHRRFLAAVAGIAVLTVGVFRVFLVWPGRPATVLTRSCRPDGCGGTVARALGTAPVQVSSSASAHPTASTSAGRAAATTRPSSSVSPTAAPTAASVGSMTGTATATATGPAIATAGPPSPAASAPQLTPGSLISINATTACCTAFYIRHDDGDDRVVITEMTAGSSALAKADATWIVQAGLASSACISFESANDPGEYLRHYDFELYLEPGDGSSQFAQDATFCPRPGNSGRGYSFESVNYPNKYIRHFDYVVYLASNGGSNTWDSATLWPDDTTWLVTQPWG
jgi:hypothetical protein